MNSSDAVQDGKLSVGKGGCVHGNEAFVFSSNSGEGFSAWGDDVDTIVGRVADDDIPSFIRGQSLGASSLSKVVEVFFPAEVQAEGIDDVLVEIRDEKALT